MLSEGYCALLVAVLSTDYVDADAAHKRLNGDLKKNSSFQKRGITVDLLINMRAQGMSWNKIALNFFDGLPKNKIRDKASSLWRIVKRSQLKER